MLGSPREWGSSNDKTPHMLQLFLFYLRFFLHDKRGLYEIDTLCKTAR